MVYASIYLLISVKTYIYYKILIFVGLSKNYNLSTSLYEIVTNSIFYHSQLFFLIFNSDTVTTSLINLTIHHEH